MKVSKPKGVNDDIRRRTNDNGIGVGCANGAVRDERWAGANDVGDGEWVFLDQSGCAAGCAGGERVCAGRA